MLIRFQEGTKEIRFSPTPGQDGWTREEYFEAATPKVNENLPAVDCIAEIVGLAGGYFKKRMDDREVERQ